MDHLLSRLFRAAMAASVLLTVTACSTVSDLTTHVQPPSWIRQPEPTFIADSSELGLEEEMSELMAMLRHDWARFATRETEAAKHLPKAAPKTEALASLPEITQPVSIRRTSTAVLASLVMPIVGITPDDLDDNYGEPRDGGRRRHRGIDIFARKGTPVVAVTDGYISYVGMQNKGGRCVWLVSEEGTAFYYAHLDQWAPGLYEGMQVQRGDLLGYVGTTGNAARTSPHLHFQIVSNDEAVNPYPYLTNSIGLPRPRPVLSGGFYRGTE